MQIPTPSEADGRRSLREHAVERAMVARTRHGGLIDAETFRQLLDDRSVVRYPTTLAFEALGLEPGEFAWAKPLGEHPAEGFTLLVHPRFANRPDLWPLLAAYHLPSINYGDIVEPDDCEAFGAALFGLRTDEYYALLCLAADDLAASTD